MPPCLGESPCISGSRISVAFILELLASGASLDSIHEAYPHLRREALTAAVPFAARATSQAERDILRALARSDQEVRAGEGFDLDSVLAEADGILKS